MKELITTDDLVFNPQGLFGDKLPFFYPLQQDDPYLKQRGAQNYGVFMAMQMANRRFSPVINAIRLLFEGQEDKATSLLREVYEEYK